MTEYLRLNRAQWDERAPAHAASPNYAFDRFAADPGFLSEVVRFDRPRLGDIRGLHTVHLQCHIGTDTVSLHRLGAHVTGLDFSGVSLDQARSLAERAGAGGAITFVESDVYEAEKVLEPGSFDLVYTGIGALCWLPDINRWAGVVAALLKPGGRLFIREGHPMLSAVDETRGDGVLAVEFPYFEREEPLVWDDDTTYVETEVQFEHNVTHLWNHGLGETVTALMTAGLELTMLQEHDSAPWDALPGFTVKDAEGEHRLADRPWRLPMSYTLQARKRSAVDS